MQCERMIRKEYQIILWKNVRVDYEGWVCKDNLSYDLMLDSLLYIFFHFGWFDGMYVTCKAYFYTISGLSLLVHVITYTVYILCLSTHIICTSI